MSILTILMLWAIVLFLVVLAYALLSFLLWLTLLQRTIERDQARKARDTAEAQVRVYELEYTEDC